jgi:hypothetical protein
MGGKRLKAKEARYLHYLILPTTSRYKEGQSLALLAILVGLKQPRYVWKREGLCQCKHPSCQENQQMSCFLVVPASESSMSQGLFT